jgi:histidinol dehydrogenase
MGFEILGLKAARESILLRRRSRPETYPQLLLQAVERIFGERATPETAVAQILSSIRTSGQDALRRWSRVIDGFEGDEFEIPSERWAKAFESLPPETRGAMTVAVDRVRDFHRSQPVRSWMTETLGGRLGQRVSPIERVGIYVPGGSAPLPSSLIMAAIPARVAGVREIVVCTPPEPKASILAAAHLCEVDALYQIGGAQAVGAMAYGTQELPPVDKIVGAGGIFVTLAKQQVFGVVGLDGLAGPTETMVIADGGADAGWVAADLLAQAEHDPLASAILLTPDRQLAQRVQSEVAARVEGLSRAEIIVQALARNSGIVITPDLDTAAEVANEYAPEHLCLSVADPEALAQKIHHAGGIFMGEHSFEVLGDYIAGPSHVMPTGGTARFASPLNLLDFVKVTSIIDLDRGAAANLVDLAAKLARLEGLTAHAAAAEARREGD